MDLVTHREFVSVRKQTRFMHDAPPRPYNSRQLPHHLPSSRKLDKELDSRRPCQLLGRKRTEMSVPDVSMSDDAWAVCVMVIVLVRSLK